MPDADIIDTIAAASTEVAMQQLARWLPAERHADLRELLHDLALSAIHAFKDVDMFRVVEHEFRVPEPSIN